MNRDTISAILGFFGVIITLLAILFISYGQASGAAIGVLIDRSSQLLTGSAGFTGFGGGFSANVIISIFSMMIALVAGFFLGGAMVSPNRAVRTTAILIMNLLRSSPWLVVLYAMLYLLPFRMTFFGISIFVSPFLKAVIGLSLPVTAYVAEGFRNGIRAVPDGQWESARALGYRRGQILRSIILPQALPMMLPNLMTTYAMLFIGTSLVVVTGTSDVLSIGKTVIASDGDEYATAIYLYILLLFFLFAYPLATWTRALERRLIKGK
ncbi:ABC transporter permease subunit [Pseudochrobactrum sp. sp1633]|uniref:ABC transporter permease subunit n=1 Tax=Pseudochrobactrum sp. sp1633 TaxID=3036706 RepID=UPI0025A5B576|nr:ABC transporter permease subunit [Pseudochrobactrum sp. sp1633]MDM8346594.1 ABC transporter permease subunit [Pseudochrobactrum sp. sp1633]HWD12632.1 ABC transporter permease subunit [Pseudochrobactrum sp.]